MSTMLQIRSYALVLLALGFSSTASAQSSSTPCSPFAPSNAQQPNITVGKITVNANDIFDLAQTNETQFIHRLGNRLHKQTSNHVVEQQLLFKTGDTFDPAKITESERLLRQNDYLKSVTITPIERCGDAININVVTKDHWSLIPSVIFNRSGGENRFGFKVTEANLFGTGKRLALAYEQGVVRDQKILEYVDNNVLGSRQQLTLQWQDNSDGERQVVDFKLPFYAFNSTRAWRIAFDHQQFETRLYTDRKITTIFDVDTNFVDINVGRSKGLQSSTLQRYWVGARLEETTLIDISNADAPSFSPERRFIYPYIAWQLQQPRFVKQQNLFMMDEVEDISLGHFFEARIGFASKSFDSSDDATLLSSEYRKGWQRGHTLGLFKTKFATVGFSDALANTIVRPQLQWFWFQSSKHTLYLSAKAAIGRNLFAENQFLAGGENGLRGYPLRMQGGDRRLLMSAEQRWYLDWYPWRLMRIGAAAFVDVGSAWNSAANEDPDWLGNAGVGLRLLSTRQANAPVMHIDLAVPFDQREDIDSLQLVVRTKAVF